MKKILALFILSFSITVGAQEQLFVKAIQDTGNFLVMTSGTPTFDQGYLVIGEVRDSFGFRSNIIFSIDSVGNEKWNKTCKQDGSTWFMFDNIIRTKDSCFFLTGSAYEKSLLDGETFCQKIDSNGDTLWTRTFKSGKLHVNSIQQTNDSGYILTGINSHEAICVSKLNKKGFCEWSKSYTYGSYDDVYKIKQCPDSSYILAGSTISWDNGFLMHISKNGDFLWANKYLYNGESYSILYDFEFNYNGFMLFMESQNYTSVIKTNFSGDVLWSKSFKLQFQDNLISEPVPKIIKTAGNSYLFFNGFGGEGSELVQIDSTGNLIWAKNFSKLLIFDAVEMKENKYFIAGDGNSRIGILKIDTTDNGLNCIYPSNITSIVDTISFQSVTFSAFSDSLHTISGMEDLVSPEIYSSNLIITDGCIYTGIKNISSFNLQVFPNPSKGSFNFVLPYSKDGLFQIYNGQGQKILQNELNALNYKVDLSEQPEGMYFYKFLFTDNTTFEGKLILLK